jgi:hypothetical protein
VTPSPPSIVTGRRLAMFAKPFQKTGRPAPPPGPVTIDLPFLAWDIVL